MKCESCGQNIPVVEDDVIDLTNDDEVVEEARENDFHIEQQCDCMHANLEGDNTDLERCQNSAKTGNGGLCTACLFGCVP